MPDNDYQANQFRSYRTTVAGLSLGFVDTAAGGYTPSMGEVIQYDGTTVVLKDGREFANVPQVRSAVSEGWLVLVDDAAPVYRPKPAGIAVRDTEQRGSERVARRSITTVGDDQRFVGNVDDRRARRERANEGASQRVALESTEARQVVARGQQAVAHTSDPELDELLGVLASVDQEWEAAQQKAEKLSREEAEELDERARAEADIIALLNSVAEQEAAAPVRAASSAPTARHATPAPSLEPAPRQSARSLPVERDESIRMPVVREPAENEGIVVASVGHRLLVDREKDIQLDVAPATPQKAAAPRPRFGGAGVVVVDEERDMGSIVTSASRTSRSLEESARVVPSSTDQVRIAGTAEVGRHKTAGEAAPPSGIDGGVTVGRILSPTTFKMTASSHISQSDIDRAAEGKPVRIEKFERTGAIATGDVDEVHVGDELEEILPEAATPPQVYRPEAEDPAYEAVRMMIPDFKWDKNRPVKEKVADALKHVKNPMYVKGILAVESELVREEIKKALGKLLSKDAAQ